MGGFGSPAAGPAVVMSPPPPPLQKMHQNQQLAIGVYPQRYIEQDFTIEPISGITFFSERDSNLDLWSMPTMPAIMKAFVSSGWG